MQIADARFVLLTSFKRDGDGVGTPVWIAPLDDGTAAFTTPSHSWKTKRIGRTPRVTVQQCDVRGTPTDGAPVIELHAEVRDDAATMQRTRAALARKYGFQYRLIGVVERVAGFVRRREVARVAIVLAEPSAS